MRKVPFIDSTGVKNLRNIIDMANQRGVKVVLSGVTDKVMASLHKLGVDEIIGKENIFPNIFPALEYANDYADKKATEHNN